MKLEFEWDEVKAATNLRAHGVSVELAQTVFKDPFGIERQDDREEYREDRFIVVGLAESHMMLAVVFTEREGRIRIISARRATQREQDNYLGKI
jgi:uncharacterized DUF497 family protein